MSNNKCKIICDLLPLYCEDMLSEESRMFVEEHLRDCEACRAELEKMKSSDIKRENTELRNFKSAMRRFKIPIELFAYACLLFFILLGFRITDSSEMMYNSLIMPLVGLIAYPVFGWRSVYKLPILLFGVNILASLMKFTESEPMEIIMMTFIYIIFVYLGASVAALIGFSVKQKKKGKGMLALRITSFVLAIVIALGLCVFADGLVGNPISKAIAGSVVRDHLNENYAGTDYELVELNYSFKDGCYYAHMHSPSQLDGTFIICISGNKIIYDTYTEDVREHRNTAERLNREYRRAVADILESQVFPYEANINYGDLDFIGDDLPDGAILQSELENNKFYNMSELGKRNGRIVLKVKNDEVTTEKAAEILTFSKKLLDDAGVAFNYVDFTLTNGTDRIDICNLKYENITFEYIIKSEFES